MTDLDLNKLDHEVLESKLQTRSVALTLPKFKMEYESRMRDVLQKLGVSEIFRQGVANLKDISNEELHVSDVIHKAVIEVNEEGSEAAAASSLQIDTRSGPIRKLMNFNKPFLFIIQDTQHKIPLFFGRVTDPEGTWPMSSLHKFVNKQLVISKMYTNIS